MKTKPREYEADGIVVEFDLARCIHAAECVRGLPEVFDPEARPWVQPAHSTPDAIAEVVARCPTGALGYRRTDGGPAEEPAAENTAQVNPGGPLYLRGNIRLHMPDGEVREETRVALCRCGDSQNKPFCDNAHVEKGFSDPGEAREHRLGPARDDAGAALTVKLAPNGPILLDGPVRVVPAAGDAAEGGKGALCRCGFSESKPYCDGAHAAAGFTTD